MKKENTKELAERLEELFASGVDEGIREHDLAKKLGLVEGGRGALRAALRQLQERGTAVPMRGGKWRSARASDGGTEGIFRMKANGTAWIAPEDADGEWFRVAPENTGGAIQGDRVRAMPAGRSAASARMFGKERGGEKWARVTEILERRRRWVVGVLRTTPYYAYLTPRDAFLPNIKVDGEVADLQRYEGRLVAAKLAPVAECAGGLHGTFLEELGDPDDPATDIPAILMDHGQTEAFAEDVMKEARSVPAPKGLAKLRKAWKSRGAASREDWRGRLTVTIDPEDAHDYDDAVTVERREGGGWLLGVHIADVAEYVEPGGKIDEEARRRSCSTYLVDRVVRMLPEELTVRVCSLQPGEDHLTHSVEMLYDAEGRLVKARTFRSVIRSAARLAYGAVQDLLDGKPGAAVPEAVRPMVLDLRDLARRLRARRFAGGALDFVLPEVHVLVDAEGRATGFQKRGSSEAYNLIEECMLAANEVVARKVRAAGVPGIYRVHDEPAEDQWARMATELHSLGVDATPRDGEDLNRIARAAHGTPGQYMITLTLLRNLQRAFYDAECRPHFGLGMECYAHFTSPIRRYPDLILHRILNALEEGRKPVYGEEDIAALARHCSACEKESAEMEIQSILTKRIRYYAEKLAAGERGPLEGVVVGLNPKGLMVELSDSLQQGLLPYALMGEGYFQMSEDQCEARTRKGAVYKLGQRVRVELREVDEKLLRVDFAPAGYAESERSAGEARREKRTGGPRSDGERKPRGKKRGGHGGHGGGGRRKRR